MKKIKLFFASCKKELNEEPFTTFSDVDAFSSADRIDKSAVGMYNALQNANYLNGRVLIYADIRGTDVVPNTFFGNMGFFGLTQANDGVVTGAWQAAYRTINETNLFVKNFTPKIALVTPAKADQYLGEAKYIRALSYFYLVNLWAQPYSFTAGATHLGVPLILEAAADPFALSNNVPRATVKAVYDQIEADLLDAEAKLPATYLDAYTKTSRATKPAARALLARLYLYKKDYTKAATYANTIITSGLHALQATPDVPFRTYTTSESIFSVAFDGGDNPNTNNSLGQHYGSQARADLPLAATFVALFNPIDLRRTSLMRVASGNTWTTKYNAGTTDWAPISRYAEILLIRAEALANLASGTTADAAAITLLNQIRTRAGVPSVTPTTKQDLLDAIYLERRFELYAEGQGSLDYLRTGRDIPAHSGVPLTAWGSNYCVLPIPFYDLQKNPNLVPNPGY